MGKKVFLTKNHFPLFWRPLKFIVFFLLQSIIFYFYLEIFPNPFFHPPRNLPKIANLQPLSLITGAERRKIFWQKSIKKKLFDSPKSAQIDRFDAHIMLQYAFFDTFSLFCQNLPKSKNFVWWRTKKMERY